MRLTITVMFLLVHNILLAQYKTLHFPINDEWFYKYGIKGLQEGDRIPDLPLGAVFNNSNAKIRISDYKGKLVILDFWNTGCISCMTGFPKMEYLQNSFKDQIQIILVNPWETEKEIKEKMRGGYLKIYKLPNLPNIVSNRTYASSEDFYRKPPLLAKYFPTQETPHHVWIDGKGIIRLRGGSENTYPEKIRDFLSGKRIQCLNSSATVPSLASDKNARYYQQLGYFKNTPLSYGSFITGFTNEVTGSGGAIREIIDSQEHSRINYFINQDLLQLYLKCFYNSKEFGEDTLRNSLLFSPSPMTAIDFTIFPIGADTLLFIADPELLNRHLTTEELIKSKYCYEQIIPMTVSKEEQFKMMMEDLNKYFRWHSDITGAIEKKMIPCYELVRSSSEEKITEKMELKYEAHKVDRQSDSLLSFKGDLQSLFATLLRPKNNQSITFLYDDNNHPLVIFNKTDIKNNERVSFQYNPKSLRSIEDIKDVLKVNGLDLVAKHKELHFLTFRNNN